MVTRNDKHREEVFVSNENMTNSKEIRVAIIGVGNCANSLIQGVTYYKDAASDVEIPGLMHAVLGGYHVRDVNFVAAFDVDAKKVGLDLADAIWASENNTIKFCDVAPTGLIVQRGHTLDGLGRYYRETIIESSDAPVDMVAVLKERKVDVLICYLPVGSEEAAKYYAQCAIDAGSGCARMRTLAHGGTPVPERARARRPALAAAKHPPGSLARVVCRCRFERGHHRHGRAGRSALRAVLNECGGGGLRLGRGSYAQFAGRGRTSTR